MAIDPFIIILGSHIHISPCNRTELGVHGITSMSRISVNCDEIWKEISSEEFVNLSPSSEHDRVSVRRLTNLLREVLEILRNPENLNRAQRQKLKIKVRQLRVQLAKESTLARRVDPSVP